MSSGLACETYRTRAQRPERPTGNFIDSAPVGSHKSDGVEKTYGPAAPGFCPSAFPVQRPAPRPMGRFWSSMEELRDVHLVEVMETVEDDRVIEVWKFKADAERSQDIWRAKGRRARMWPERVQAR